MRLQLQDKRCVFDKHNENKPPSVEKQINIKDKITKNSIETETKTKIETKIESEKPAAPIENKEQNENIALQPKKKGNSLFTISANVKTSNGKFFVTKIIEEADEKKAKILYEKEVKKELGKPRSVTKLLIEKYKIGDEEFVEELIEDTTPKEENKELSLYEKTLDILCNSPYIHIFKIPSPKAGNGKFHYGIYASEEHLRDSLKETLDEVQSKIDKADFGMDELNREQRKEAEKAIGANERFYQKMVSGAKQLSEQDIKNDKNVIKYIGKQNDKWYKSIIDIHEEEKYEAENKLSIAKENIIKILNSDNINLYIMQLEDFDKSSVLIAARTSEQANQIGMCSEHTLNLLKENIPEENGKREVNVNARVMELDEKSMFKIFEEDEAFNDLLSRNTFTTKLIVKQGFTLNKLDKFLDKVDAVNSMTEEEKEKAVQELMKNKLLPEDFKGRMDFLSTQKIIEKINEIKGDA